MKTKIAIALLIIGPLLVAAGFNLIYGLTGALIAVGVILMGYGAVMLSD